MTQVQISDSIKREVSFEEMIQDCDSPLALACDNVNVSFWNEYHGMTHTFILMADTKDEIEEKTMELLHEIDMLTKNRIITVNENDEVEIGGFPLERFERSAKTHYDIVTCYGGGYKHISDFVYDFLPSNFFEFEDDDNVKMVLFFNRYEDLFGDMSEEDKEVYADDYKLNEEAIKFGLEEKAYGEIVILTRDFASKYINLD